MQQQQLTQRRIGSGHRKLRRSASRRTVAPVAGVNEFFKDLFDFNSWAPRSSQIWRLNQYAYTEGDLIQRKKEEELAALEAQLQDPKEGTAVSAATGKLQEQALGSFADAGDAQIASALGRRVAQVATLGPAAREMGEAELESPLSGQELRELIAFKYGKTHDVSIVRRDIPGKTLVSLNIMWNHMEQRSFKLTEEQYMDKLDSVAAIVTALQQAPRVRSFLRTPARAQGGLPARPVVGTAISIRLHLDDEVIKEWFSTGYQ